MRNVCALAFALAGVTIVGLSVTAPAGATTVYWIPGVTLIACAAGLVTRQRS